MSSPPPTEPEYVLYHGLLGLAPLIGVVGIIIGLGVGSLFGLPDYGMFLSAIGGGLLSGGSYWALMRMC